MGIQELSIFISKYSPLLGSFISLDNPILGFVINIIAKLFGADPKNIQDIIQKISTDPDAATKLKQIELQHEETLYQAQVSDRQSARTREEEIVKITGKREYILNFIAITVILGYFAMCALVSFTRMDKSDHDVLYMMLGQLTGGFIMVLSYYFGSSKT